MAEKKSNPIDDLEWMRINAERDRICQYRTMAQGAALSYYKVLRELVEVGHGNLMLGNSQNNSVN